MNVQRISVVFLLSSILLCACDEVSTPSMDNDVLGPKLIFDVHAVTYSSAGIIEGLSFPLPNDAIFTSNKTWQLINPLDEIQELERWRQNVSLLDGAPLLPVISAPLNQEIEIDELIVRHNNESPLDDAIFLMCLSIHCEGELVPIDLGRPSEDFGLFSELNTLAEMSSTPTASYLSKLSAPVPLSLSQQDQETEDSTELSKILNQYAAGERSLLWDSEAQSSGTILLSKAPSLGETATVLTFRPQYLLRPRTEYAVVLTTAIQSAEGSMSQYVVGHLPKKTKRKLPQVRSLLLDLGIQKSDVATAWTFTTGEPLAIKRALGDTVSDQPMGKLYERVQAFQPSINTVHRWSSRASEEACNARNGRECRVDIEQVALPVKGVRGLALAWAEKRGVSAAEKSALYESYKAVKGLFSGELRGWYVSDWKGQSKGDELTVRDVIRPFWCVIPESGEWLDQSLQTRQRQAPFPVLLWSSDSGNERLNLLLWAGHFARAGYASCAIESKLEQQNRVDESFALNLSILWREFGWSPNLAAQVTAITPQIGDQLSHSVLSEIDRPLNRALALHQLSWWLAQPNESEKDYELEVLKTLTLLPTEMGNQEVEQAANSSEHPNGVLVFGGEGEGATAAVLSSVMNTSTSAVITVDLAADLIRHQVIGTGHGGADVFLNRRLGPWLIWDQEQEGWKWSQDTQGRPQVQLWDEVNESSGQRVEVLDWSSMSSQSIDKRWFALYNHRTEQVGRRIPYEEGSTQSIALTVPVQKDDILSVYMYDSEEATEPNKVSQHKILAPFSGLSMTPADEGVRTHWLLSQWQHALDDPLESSRALLDSSEVRENEIKSLVIAHPRSTSYPMSASLRMSQALKLMSAEERSELYELTTDEFLILTQAYEPMRAWGQPWMDWDDLDLLEYATPSFTRNSQLSLSRSTFAGGYHALKLPWRLDQSFGLELPGNPDEALETFSMNMINRFLNGLSRSASAEELEEQCLHNLVPSLKACSFLSVTVQDRSD